MKLKIQVATNPTFTRLMILFLNCCSLLKNSFILNNKTTLEFVTKVTASTIKNINPVYPKLNENNLSRYIKDSFQPIIEPVQKNTRYPIANNSNNVDNSKYLRILILRLIKNEIKNEDNNAVNAKITMIKTNEFCTGSARPLSMAETDKDM